MDNRRIHTVDGLRGVCVLLVALFHCFLFVDIQGIGNIEERSLTLQYGPQFFITQLLLLFFNGREAVAIFFVISGLVISISLTHSQLSIKTVLILLIKRLFRLLPVYYLSLSLILIYLPYFTKPTTIASISAHLGEYHIHNFFKGLLSNILFTSTSFNPVAWTLPVELFASILSPFFYLMKKSKTIIDVYFLFILAVCNVLPLPDIFRYLFFFYLGFYLEKNKLFFIKLATCNLIYRIFFFAIVIALVLANNLFLLPPTLYLFIQGVAAFFIVGIVAFHSSPLVKKIFLHTIFQFYGKISYSFYILHYLFLYFFNWKIYTRICHL